MDKGKTYKPSKNLPVRTMPNKVQKEMTEQIVGDKFKKFKNRL